MEHLRASEKLPKAFSLRNSEAGTVHIDVAGHSGNASAGIPGRVRFIEPAYAEHQLVLENHLQIREEVSASSCPIDRVAETIELLKQVTRHFSEIDVPRETTTQVA